MPAAAVIPAPIAYTKVVAVKKLVVGLLRWAPAPSTGRVSVSLVFLPGDGSPASGTFTLRKSECSQQAYALHVVAWDNDIECVRLSSAEGRALKINRNSWGHSYFTGRGEILGSVKDELLRKHLPRMFSLIKNES